MRKRTKSADATTADPTSENGEVVAIIPQNIGFAPDGVWPATTHYGQTLDAFMRRMDRLQDILVTRGGFTRNEASDFLSRGTDDSSEKIVSWLRRELATLRTGERTIGAAPVLTGAALSRLEIADLTMTLIEIGGPINENLQCLLAELLDIDRHRTALAGNRHEAFEQAAAIEGQFAAEGRAIGVRELARMLSVEASTISRWRLDHEYKKSVEDMKRMASQPWFQDIKARHAK
jgi:hypothetical protein